MFGLKRRQKKFLIYNQNKLQLISLNGKAVQKESVSVKDDEASSLLPNSSFNENVKEASVLLPAGKLLIRVYDLPAGADKKIENIVNYKFIADLPFDREELYYSYYVDEDYTGLKVILFAVRRNYVDDIYQLCQNMSIKIKGIFPLPVFNYVNYRNRVIEEELDKPLFIDYFGEASQSFYWFGDEEIYIRGSEATSPDTVRSEINKTRDYIEKYLESDYGRMFFNNQEIENVEDDRIEIDDTYRQLWYHISDSIGQFKDIDLMEQLPQVDGNRRRYNKILITVLIFLIILVNGFTFWMNWNQRAEKVVQLEEEIELLQPEMLELESIREEYEEKNEIVSVYREELGYETKSFLPWLYELSRVLPVGVEIDRINFIDEELALIAGKADSASEVMQNLESSEYFTELNFVGSISVEDDGESFRIAGDLSEKFE